MKGNLPYDMRGTHHCGMTLRDGEFDDGPIAIREDPLELVDRLFIYVLEGPAQTNEWLQSNRESSLLIDEGEAESGRVSRGGFDGTWGGARGDPTVRRAG